MNLSRIVSAAMLLAACGVAQAQVVPKPKEFYFDQDPAAQPIVVVKAEGEALTEQLIRERERGRRKAEATAQLAQVAMRSDRVELGKSLYEQAVAASAASGSMGRNIRWNYGWDLYRNGDHALALAQWVDSISGYGGPSWVPPTFALGLWVNGRRSEAVQWYAAAVRTEPNLWNDPANFPKLLPGWRQQDRDMLAEVNAAWAANPPAWP